MTWLAVRQIQCQLFGHDPGRWAYRKSAEPMTVRTRHCKRCGRQEHEEAPTPKRTRITQKRKLREMNGADTVKG